MYMCVCICCEYVFTKKDHILYLMCLRQDMYVKLLQRHPYFIPEVCNLFNIIIILRYII